MAGRARVVAVVTALACLALTTSASAEGFADLFLGASITPRGDVNLRIDGTRLRSTDQDYETSFLVGGRAGYWWGIVGVNLDVKYFRPEFDPDAVTIVDPAFTFTANTDLDVVGIGINAMLRGQFLKDSQVPQGRLQPYIFGGPTLFISTFDVDSTLTVGAVTTTVSGYETDASVGLTVGGGLTYMVTRRIGAFGEYRFTHNTPEFDVLGVTVEPELNTHHLLAGVTFRF